MINNYFRTDETVLEYDDESDGEFEGQLFNSTSNFTMLNNFQSRNAQIGSHQRQYSLAVSPVLISNQSRLTAVNKSITRDATCDDTSSASSSAVEETRIPNGTIGNKTLKALPFKRSTGVKSPLLHNSYTAINQQLSSNLATANLLLPIDVILLSQKYQSQVSVTLNDSGLYNESLRNDNSSNYSKLNNSSTSTIPRTTSATCNGLLTTSSLNAINKSRSLSNLENMPPHTPKQRVCISPTTCISGNNSTTTQHYPSALRQLNRQNLKLSLDLSNITNVNNLAGGNFETISKQLSQTSLLSSTTTQSNQSSDIMPKAVNGATTAPSPIRIFPRQQNIVAEVNFSISNKF